MKDPSELPKEQLAEFVSTVRELIYLDTTGERPYWSSGAETGGADLVADVVTLLDSLDLTPDDAPVSVADLQELRTLSADQRLRAIAALKDEEALHEAADRTTAYPAKYDREAVARNIASLQAGLALAPGDYVLLAFMLPVIATGTDSRTLYVFVGENEDEIFDKVNGLPDAGPVDATPAEPPAEAPAEPLAEDTATTDEAPAPSADA